MKSKDETAKFAARAAERFGPPPSGAEINTTARSYGLDGDPFAG